MKYFITIGLLIGLISCESYEESAVAFAQAIDERPQYITPTKIVIIDGCEYIETLSDNFERRDYTLTHKGNCKNHSR